MEQADYRQESSRIISLKISIGDASKLPKEKLRVRV
jgi:hypothetical protein